VFRAKALLLAEQFTEYYNVTIRNNMEIGKTELSLLDLKSDSFIK
jgi:hypothetical protein